MQKKIAVLGAGAWGTALGNFLALSHNHNVTLWARDEVQLFSLQKDYINHKYLPNISLSQNLNFSNDLSIIKNQDIIVIATPSSAFDLMLDNIKPYLENQAIVWLCKGFINYKQKVYFAHELVQEILEYDNSGVLTGPSFAQEVALNLPFALTAGSKSKAWRDNIQSSLHQNNLRIYTTDDIVGCEIGGALKNILALATGIANGLGLGLNSQAALLTRGISEMMRFGAKLGANIHTLMGLSGLGDLILTSTGDLSRNRKVGISLGQGISLDIILKNLGHVAEGVSSAKLAFEIARKHNLDTPIIDAVNDILFNNQTPQQVVQNLLARQAKAESI